MPTPTKPYAVLVNENKSHRTKSELEARKKEEEKLITSIEMKPHSDVKKSPIAYKEFKKIKKLLSAIDKDDALYENIINRYAILIAECKDFEEKREFFYKNSMDLEKEYSKQVSMYGDDGEMSLSEYMKLQSSLEKSIIDLDKQVQSKRKMLFDIEKESVMTIASSLRSIPKKDNETETDPLLKILRGG